jgi:hypothetical protein
MQFLVRVRTTSGAIKKGKVKAPSARALRAGLAKKGLELLAFRAIEPAAVAEPAVAEPRPAAVNEVKTPSRLLKSRVANQPATRPKDPVAALEEALAPELEDKLSQLEGLLKNADEDNSLIPVHMFLETVILGDDELCVLGLCVLAKHALCRIARGENPDEVLHFLNETCGIQEEICRMVVGMAIDSGKISTGVAAGELTKEDGIQNILRNAPGAEEEMVRSLIGRCLPFVEGFGDPEGLLTQIEVFEDRWA